MQSLTGPLKKVLDLFVLALRKLALLLIETYRLVLSPYIGGNCRFHPSCSVYATEAFQKHSPWTAFYLTVVRLLKCRPGGASGFDPVPDKHLCCVRGHHEFSK